MISKLNAAPPDLPRPIPLEKRLRDYLEPEPVAPEYYLSEERLKGLIWSNEKEEQKGFGYRFDPVTEERESQNSHEPCRIPQDRQLPGSVRETIMTRFDYIRIPSIRAYNNSDR